jgi:hypothetical protein
MKEILNIFVWGGMIYFLFIFLRGMNEQQIQKHDEAIKKNEAITKGNHKDD